MTEKKRTLDDVKKCHILQQGSQELLLFLLDRTFQKDIQCRPFSGTATPQLWGPEVLRGDGVGGHQKRNCLLWPFGARHSRSLSTNLVMGLSCDVYGMTRVNIG